MPELTERCNIRCQKAMSYRCRCSCDGMSHASVSHAARGQTAPALSTDMQPDSRFWTRQKTARGIRPVPTEIPKPRQLEFAQIAAIWPEPETPDD